MVAKPFWQNPGFKSGDKDFIPKNNIDIQRVFMETGELKNSAFYSEFMKRYRYDERYYDPIIRRIGPNTQMNATNGLIQIGADGYIGGWSIIAASGTEVKIGHTLMMADHSYIIAIGHTLELDKQFSRGAVHKPITIGDCCWIGVGAIILKGVVLGNNVVVGAGSVVTNSFPDDVVIAGNPAKIIKVIK